ncbi:MAG: permease prefix domain 1-containing protein [Treponema sp.]|nr:permease prefix domain 1-containing protein [Treponema sp.]
MKEKMYVDRLFAGCEETPEIKDFKEEITANLRERVKELSLKMDEEQAFEKAAAELGDIKAIADDIGRKKSNETIGRMYMKAKTPVTKRTAAGMTAATAFLLLAAGIALIMLLRGTEQAGILYLSAALFSVSCSLFTYFGLTHETAAHYAMKKSRGAAYAIVCLLAVLGVSLAVAAFLFAGLKISSAVAIKSVLILPAVCALVFLLATEPKRRKPWLQAAIERETENSFDLNSEIMDPVTAAKFGITSGGLWILAIAVFVTLGLIFGWQYVWLVFIFTLAIQVFMLASVFGKKK